MKKTFWRSLLGYLIQTKSKTYLRQRLQRSASFKSAIEVVIVQHPSILIRHEHLERVHAILLGHQLFHLLFDRGRPPCYAYMKTVIAADLENVYQTSVKNYFYLSQKQWSKKLLNVILTNEKLGIEYTIKFNTV